MLLLTIDTSGKYGSLALARGDPNGACEALEVVPLTGGTFSAQLVPQIASLLSKHRFSKNDIGAFVVASGPGSFTGLRVGLAAIKALAEVLQKPIAAVSLLEAVAISCNVRGTVVAALDAGRGEIYTGQYEVHESTRLLAESLLTRDQFVATASSLLVLTPDENVHALCTQAGLEVELVPRPRSDAIARMGWKKILSGETVSPESLDANYIRRSDAEIVAAPNR